MKKMKAKLLMKRALCLLLSGAMSAPAFAAAAPIYPVLAAEQEAGQGEDNGIYMDNGGVPLEMTCPEVSMENLQSDTDQFIDPISIGIMLAIIGVEKIVDSTRWGQAVKEFFGGDIQAQKVLDKINEITSKLNEINNKLDKIIEMIITNGKRDEITRKLKLTRQAETHTVEFLKSFEAAGNIELKEKELDKWYNNSIGSQSNMINFIDLYSKMITNSDGNNTFGDFFSLYDELAIRTYAWQSDRDAFVNLNQQKDIQLLLKMSVLSGLWLSKEKIAAQKANNEARLKVLEEKTKVVKEALGRVQKLAEAHKPMNCLESGNNILYYDNKEIMLTTDPAVIETAVYNDVAFNSTLRDEWEYTATLIRSKEYIEKVLGGHKKDGFTLMTTPQFDFFANFANKQGTTIAKLFNDKGIVMGGITTGRNAGRVLLSFDNDANQPLRVNNPRAGGWRYLNIVRGNTMTNSQMSLSFQDASMRITDFGRYVHYFNHNRYEVTDNREDRDTLVESVNPSYGLIWVKTLKGTFPADQEAQDANAETPVYDVEGAVTRVDGQRFEIMDANGELREFIFNEKSVLYEKEQEGRGICAEDLSEGMNIRIRYMVVTEKEVKGGIEQAGDNWVAEMFTIIE